MKHSTSLPMLLLVLGLAVVCQDLALATVHEPWGSPGGEYFRADCPKGSYLVGLDGKAGGWVDRIATVCAPWLPAQQIFGATTVGKYHGTSRGGKPRQTICSGAGINNRAVQSWTVEILRSDNKFVQSVQGHCTSLGSPASTARWGFGSLTEYPEPSTLFPLYYPDDALRRTHVCPAGEMAVGIHGRAGFFVDALGLICGPLPQGPGEPATKVNPLAVAPGSAATTVNPLAVAPVSDDMFTILKPADGDRVVQGQLALLVKPPKVGVPSVTVLEFRWLDAPPTQPYIYTFAVETPKLLQGYPVDQRVTAGNAGRWEVRARIAAQPVAGPWSLPVGFQLVVTQPLQSMQPAPPPNSSIMQAPTPGVGVAPSVVHPPPSSSQGTGSSSLFIRPRGVDEPEKQEGGEPTIIQPSPFDPTEETTPKEKKRLRPLKFVG